MWEEKNKSNRKLRTVARNCFVMRAGGNIGVLEAFPKKTVKDGRKMVVPLTDEDTWTGN